MTATITKAQAAILLACASKDITRPILRWIRIRKNGVAEATNGHIVARVRVGDNGAEAPMDRYIDPARLRLMRGKDDRLAVDMTDGRATIIGDTVAQLDPLPTETDDGTYPETDKVWPAEEAVQYRISLSAKYLETICKSAPGPGYRRVRLAFTGPEKAAFWETETAKGIIMPLRDEG